MKTSYRVRQPVISPGARSAAGPIASAHPASRPAL
jgi:hypothetical protein